MVWSASPNTVPQRQRGAVMEKYSQCIHTELKPVVLSLLEAHRHALRLEFARFGI